MLDFLAYVVGFAVAMSVIALCLEHLALSRRLPRRHIWTLAMFSSALLPPLLILMAGAQPVGATDATRIAPVQSTVPNDARSVASSETSSLPSGAAALEAVTAAPARNWQLPAPSRTSLLAAWATISGALLAVLAGTGLQLRRRSTHWQRNVIQAHEVLVSEDTGPALLGALRPQIVVPRWFMDEPADTQLLILQHEQQHIAARDPLLLRVTMLIAITAPWNLPLWWQLKRLRLAIELDCDARVMRSGAEAGRYGEVLLGVTQRATAMPLGVIAMSEPVSALEQRIRSLSPARGRHAVLRMIGALSLTAAGIAAAAALEVPALPQVAQAPVVRPASPATTDTPASRAATAIPASPATPASAAVPARAPLPGADSTAVGAARPSLPTAQTESPSVINGMDLRELIATSGRKFQKRFVVDPRVRGTVETDSLETASLSYHAFLVVLGVNGFVAVPSGDVVTIIPEMNARTTAMPIMRADNIQGDDAEVVTVLIPTDGIQLGAENYKPSDVAPYIATSMRVLVSFAGSITPMADGKSVLLVDRAGNAKRIVALVQSMSKSK